MEMLETGILKIEETVKTPRVFFDRVNGRMELSGVSIPENGALFYKPVLEWLSTYASTPALKTEITICLDYFNISSSKMILFIFYKLMEVRDSGNEVKVNWMFADEELLEAGTDYQQMTKLNFNYRKVPYIKTLQN